MSEYDPYKDPEIMGEAVIWGWKLHISQDGVNALLKTEAVIDKIVDKVLDQPELVELKPISSVIKWTLKHHRKREQKIADKWGTGVVLVSPWTMPTLMRPEKQHVDDTHMFWTSFDLSQQSWGETQTMDDTFQSETGPAICGFGDKLFSVYRGAGSDSQLYYSIFQANADGSDDWSDPLPVAGHRTTDEPALAVLNGELLCIYKGDDDTQILYTKWTGSGWSSYDTIPGLRGKAGPGAAVYGSGSLFVAVPGSKDSGQEDHFWWSVYKNGSWSPAYCSSHDKTSLPPALVTHDGAVRVIYTGTDHSFFIMTFTSDTTLSTAMKFPDHESSDGPSAVSYGGVIYIVSRGYKDDQIWFTYSKDDGRTWTKHAQIKNPGYLYSGKRPGLTTWRHSTGTRDQLLMLYRGAQS